MYKITWDKETGGVQLHSRIVEGTLGISPRPVFWEELDLLKLNELGWIYPHTEEPLLWALNKQYWYRGELMFEAKGANIYDDATIDFEVGKERMTLDPVNVEAMLEKNKEYMFLLESEAIEFIHETDEQYAGARKSVNSVAANQLDYEALAARAEKKSKTKMAIVKEDCDSFDIVPLTEAEKQGKKVYHTTKIDKFIASFSGGKDSQVVLDLCTRAIPSTDFQVIYSDTGYELPSSLDLYKNIQQHYHAIFPDLKFSLAKNHESVTNYWDKIGTPSDTHRWCCTIMKTAPLYRSLKVDGTNKQAKVLTFDGVRAEESVRRGSYVRFGKGKHTSIYNAHPILNWNAIEIFMYLFRHQLPINFAYRIGKARVGCVICPFSTSWDDMIANKAYSKEMEPFVDRIKIWSKKCHIGNQIEFLRDRKWKIKAIGDTKLIETTVSFTEVNSDFVADVVKSQHSIYDWLPTIGDYSITKEEKKDIGTLQYNKRIYDFEIDYNQEKKSYHFRLHDCNDLKLAFLLRRVINKSAYCVHCEVCEVDCPTGALTILPDTKIDRDKCIHCHKCLEVHEQGCIAADCVRMIKNMNNNQNTKIQGYKTFGLREEWLDEYLVDPEYFWKDNTLGTAQVDGFKAWLKDAEIINAKNKITPFGELLEIIRENEPDLLWELIITNLSYNSFIVRWFANNIKIGQPYDKKSMEGMIIEQGYGNSGKTVGNAVAALVQTMEYSPVGNQLKWAIPFDSQRKARASYSDITIAGLAYSLYKYAEENGVRNLSVSGFYDNECTSGPAKVLGIDKSTFVKTLRALNSLENRVLVAELNMGLDSISLRDDLSSLSCIQILTNK